MVNMAGLGANLGPAFACSALGWRLADHARHQCDESIILERLGQKRLIPPRMTRRLVIDTGQDEGDGAEGWFGKQPIAELDATHREQHGFTDDELDRLAPEDSPALVGIPGVYHAIAGLRHGYRAVHILHSHASSPAGERD
jgi:hypothetical protein